MIKNNHQKRFKPIKSYALYRKMKTNISIFQQIDK